MGMVARRGLKGEADADVVKFMKEAGAILIAITNVPELNLWCETRCNVYGQTNNPYDTTRTVGGSSGGEVSFHMHIISLINRKSVVTSATPQLQAAILASCGSPFGIGSDIGGSVRMPAFYCGIFGHKPTTGQPLI